jgi:hypothetical protein
VLLSNLLNPIGHLTEREILRMRILVHRYKLLLKVLTTIVFLAAPVIVTPLANADTATHLVISEIQTSGDGGAKDEFIEIYNPTDSAISIGTWSIQYKPATSATIYKKNFDTGDSVAAYGFFLVARRPEDGYNGPAADMEHASFEMAADNGHIFLVNDKDFLTDPNTDPNIVDKVGYGSTADSPEISPAPSPPGSESSIERKPGATQPDKGNGEDTDDNSADFDTRTTSEPQNTSSSTEQPPTAITLSSFTAQPTTSQATFFRWQWLALAVGLVFGEVAVVRRLLGR